MSDKPILIESKEDYLVIFRDFYYWVHIAGSDSLYDLKMKLKRQASVIEKRTPDIVEINDNLYAYSDRAKQVIVESRENQELKQRQREEAVQRYEYHKSLAMKQLGFIEEAMSNPFPKEEDDGYENMFASSISAEPKKLSFFAKIGRFFS